MRGAESRVSIGKSGTVVRVGRPSGAVQAPPQAVDRGPLLARLGSGALAIALAAAVVYMLTGPTFKVAQVEVTGQSLLTRAEIVQAAGVVGQSAFSVDRLQVANAIAALGTVRDVEVGVALPDTVTITVREHEPRYAWETPAERYLVDERGVVLGTGAGASDLPVVRDPLGPVKGRGEMVDLSALQAASDLARLWPSALGPVPDCEYLDGGLQLVGDAWRVELGPGTDLEAKVLALGAVMAHAEAEGQTPSFVDVRLPERPYYR